MTDLEQRLTRRGALQPAGGLGLTAFVAACADDGGGSAANSAATTESAAATAQDVPNSSDGIYAQSGGVTVVAVDVGADSAAGAVTLGVERA